MTRETLVRDLEKRKARLGTWKAVAESLGVSQQHINDIKENRRDPGPQFLRAMGLERIVTYRSTNHKEKR